MKNNGTKSFLFIQTVIIVLIGLTTGCTRDKPEFIPGVLAHYINKARLTTVSVKSTLEGKVNTNNVDSWAAIIVDNAAGISILDSVNLEVFKFADSQDYQTRRDDALTDFKARNLIRIGDKVVKTTWSQNGQVFLETYGVERDNGETFEPVPHFHIDEVNSVFVPARPGSWNISSRELYVKNGFGVKAAQGKWDIVIRGNACDITGPPIKVINTLCNEVWLYDAACNDGYKIYAEPKASCPGGQQECMQWVIQLGYTRPDNVSVQVGAAATLYGVTLRGKIDSNDIAWGGTKADWGILCVESGDITSPTSTVIGTSTSSEEYVTGYREDQSPPRIGARHGAWRDLGEFRAYMEEVLADPDSEMGTKCWCIDGKLISDDGTPDGLTIEVESYTEIPCTE